MMMRQERAKQFQPFDAMKGLQEALRDREEHHTRVERHEISEEQMEKNSEVFQKLKKGMLIRMDCYVAFHDVSITAIVTSIDLSFRFLKMGKEKMYFSDIYQIEILEMPNGK